MNTLSYAIFGGLEILIIKMKEHLGLWDIWRLKNFNVKQFTFRQKRASDFTQRKLVYFFYSQNLQEVITQADYLGASSTDHSSVNILISTNRNCVHGHGFWKFKRLLLSDQKYVRKTKNLIQNFHSNLKHSLIQP